MSDVQSVTDVRTGTLQIAGLFLRGVFSFSKKEILTKFMMVRPSLNERADSGMIELMTERLDIFLISRW